MGSVFKRRRRWYIKYRHPTKGWIIRSTGTEDEDEARGMLAKVEADIEDANRGREEPAHQDLKIELGRAYSPRLHDLVGAWLRDRANVGQRNVANEEGHFRIHILPELGHRAVAEIKPKEVRLFVKKLRKKPPTKGKGADARTAPQEERTLAPRTVRKIYGTMRTFFGDLVADEVITDNPCKLARRDLPKNIDKDVDWRSGAIFTAAEVVALLQDERIPEDHRFLHTILFLTGARLGEALGLRFSHIEREVEPLQRLTIARSYDQRTKTDAVRVVPVHPTLAAALARWKLSGYAELVGRPPRPDDFVVPGVMVSPGRNRIVSVRLDARGEVMMRDRHRVRKDWLPDLDMLGFRHRRLQDTRRTFITMAREAGADDRVLKRITHTPPESMLDIYSTFSWPTMCKAVMVIDLGLSARAVLRRHT